LPKVKNWSSETQRGFYWNIYFINSNIILAIKNIERVISIGVLIESFAFFAIRRIKIPVIPAEIAPPIPRIEVKLIIWKYSVRT